jgi:hypothetical protein
LFLRGGYQARENDEFSVLQNLPAFIALVTRPRDSPTRQRIRKFRSFRAISASSPGLLLPTMAAWLPEDA